LVKPIPFRELAREIERLPPDEDPDEWIERRFRRPYDELIYPTPGSGPTLEDYTSSRDYENIAYLLTDWLRRGCVAPAMGYDPDRGLSVVTACPTLFSAIGIALANTVRDANVCDRCGSELLDTRQQRYCAACKTAAKTEQKRQQRARQLSPQPPATD
jgi:hypothetical protein